jgi:hypothetical protein
MGPGALRKIRIGAQQYSVPAAVVFWIKLASHRAKKFVKE